MRKLRVAIPIPLALLLLAFFFLPWVTGEFGEVTATGWQLAVGETTRHGPENAPMPDIISRPDGPYPAGLRPAPGGGYTSPLIGGTLQMEDKDRRRLWAFGGVAIAATSVAKVVKTTLFGFTSRIL